MDTAKVLAIGLAAGVCGGMFGIGGGLIMVPALLFFMNMQHQDATGTSLASLVMPVGILGAIQYYQTGHVNLRYAGLLACGLFVGMYFGARFILGVSPDFAKRLYGVFMLVIGFRMAFFGK